MVENYGVLVDFRIEVIYDDVRYFLVMIDE